MCKAIVWLDELINYDSVSGAAGSAKYMMTSGLAICAHQDGYKNQYSNITVKIPRCEDFS